MRSRGTSTAAVAMLLLVLLLATWAAVSGPPSLRVSDRTLHVPGARHQTPTPSPSASPTSHQAPHPAQDSHGSHSWFGWLPVAFDVIAAVLVLLLAWWLLRKLQRARRDRARRRRVAVEVDEPEEPAEAARAALRRAHDEQMAALSELPPRNAVVRCWMLFEQAAAESHVERHPSETSTEFAVRLLHEVDVDPTAVGRLLEVYGEARFSSHPISADQVDRARRAVERVHADLARPFREPV